MLECQGGSCYPNGIVIYSRFVLPLVKQETWNTPEDIKRSFPSVSFVGGDCLVFNIKGNAYRLVARVRYKKPSTKQGVVHVIRVMTHAEYDKVET